MTRFASTVIFQNAFIQAGGVTVQEEKLRMAKKEGRRMKVSLMFAWYDMWIGLFWDQKKQTLYLFPLPMIGMKIQITQRG